ncbi:MAG: energy transducer TonB [Bacteroidetes bacterium]|nr:energy transducer TonB [Bacteroidota bacterium]MBU1114553.1 energy transducer TonB [Bacteroidota bacterium]MBU1800470.1 energy transducer TonB [Bacteroidota bacterium]
MALKKNPKIDIKRKYYRVFQISLILSLSLMILAFKFFPKIEKDAIASIIPQVLIIGEDVIPTKLDLVIPEPPKPLIPIESPTDDLLDDIAIETSIWDEKDNIGITTHKPLSNDVDEDLNIIFVAVEQMPKPLGGIAAIQSKIVYPEIAKRAGIQGRVYVKAFVDENGNVFNVELLKGIGGGCDESALVAVKSSKFIPGKQRDKPVKCQVTIPILFKLQ